MPLSDPLHRSTAPTSPGQIQVRGARTHNLQNIDVDLPRDQLVVMTGPSGSGKSSLAFDTLFAEGQRQYIESLTMYARQFFDQLPRPDVDRIDGIPPTLSLQQSRQRANRRSTVGTVTEIYDFLRVLMARAGEIHCYRCGEPIRQQAPEQIRDRVLQYPERTRIMILAPLVSGKRGGHGGVFETVRRERLVRVRVDGEVHDIDRLPVLAPGGVHTIEAITDRVIVREGVEDRLLEAIDAAARISSDGQVVICRDHIDDQGEREWVDQLYSTRFSCPACDLQYAEVQPRCFSFNSPFGACEVCEGLGWLIQFDPACVVDRQRSIDDGALAIWETLPAAKRRQWKQRLQPILEQLSISTDQPLDQLEAATWQTFLEQHDRDAPGLWTLLEREWATTTDDDRRLELETLQSSLPCPECDGARVSRLARSVYFSQRSIADLTHLSLAELHTFFQAAKTEYQGLHADVVNPLADQITHRLEFLNRVGLDYLTLGRGFDTLSAGEQQRVRLAAAIGTGVTRVGFVLDEPSVGLHARDTERLIGTLRQLQHAGNSLIVVEHNAAVMRSADWIVDLGPGAGPAGGRVVASGTPEQIIHDPASVTGPYLASDAAPALNANPLPPNQAWVSLTGARGNNLQDVAVAIPMGRMTCVTGVSGSGKSTLIHRTLAPAVAAAIGAAGPTLDPFDTLTGTGTLERLKVVDQKPIGRTPRACPATFCQLLDPIRKLFAATRDAKRLGFGVGRFSFNGKAGWCPECRGLGFRTIEMRVLPDVFVECDACGGKRYNRQTLQVRYAGRSISDVLRLNIDQAVEVFSEISHLREPLETLRDVGLGYLQLGQSATTLSGGEAQRLKLARELARADHRPTIYFLDEPTSGLHFQDIDNLMGVLRKLVAQGHTLVLVEHDLSVIAAADWVVDLGPGGGDAGGKLVAKGTPAEVAATESSITGACLRDWTGQ